MDEPLTAEDLVGQYKEGVRDFSGVNLFRAKLTGVELEGIILLDAYLVGADLSRASFRHANIAYLLWVDRNGLWLHNVSVAGRTQIAYVIGYCRQDSAQPDVLAYRKGFPE